MAISHADDPLGSNQDLITSALEVLAEVRNGLLSKELPGNR